MIELLVISLGAIVGANARYLLSRFAARELGPVFPYGTLFINIAGSLIVGFFVVWTTERVLADPRWRLLVVVGFCGSFTTFSSYAFETMAYFEQGQWLLMLTNVLSNNLLCLGGASGRHGSGAGAVKCQTRWLFKSRSTSTKPTSGITGRCTWKSSTTCGGKTCMPQPQSMPWLDFLADTGCKPVIWWTPEESFP